MSNLLDEAKHLKAIGEFSSTEEAINFIIFDTVTPKKEIEEMKESATQEGISFCKVCGSAMIDGECYLCKKVSESCQCVQTDQPAEVFYKSKEVKDLTLGSVVAAVDEDDEDEDEPTERKRPDGERSRDKGQDMKSKRIVHRGIPTWEEAVGYLVDANLESRSKKPDTGGFRPRSGHRRGGNRDGNRGRS